MSKITEIKNVVVSKTVAAYQEAVASIEAIKKQDQESLEESTNTARAANTAEKEAETKRQSERKEEESARANARSKKLEELQTSTDGNEFIDSLDELNAAVAAYEAAYNVSLSDLEEKRKKEISDYSDTRGSYAEFNNAFTGVDGVA